MPILTTCDVAPANSSVLCLVARGARIELNSSGIEYGHTNQDVHEKIMSYNFIPISYDYVNRKISRLESYNKSGGNNTIYVKYFDQTAKQVRESAAIIVHTAFGMSI